MHRHLRVLARVAALTAAFAPAACGQPPELPAGSTRFEVPTYAWDRQAGEDALVSGRLA